MNLLSDYIYLELWFETKILLVFHFFADKLTKQFFVYKYVRNQTVSLFDKYVVPLHEVAKKQKVITYQITVQKHL